MCVCVCALQDVNYITEIKIALAFTPFLCHMFQMSDWEQLGEGDFEETQIPPTPGKSKQILTARGEKKKSACARACVCLRLREILIYTVHCLLS